MKREPRKVFLLKNGSYIGISYNEFCNKRDTDKFFADKLFIPVQGYLLECDKEHYQAFYKDKERQRYLQSLDYQNKLLSIDAFDNEASNGMDFLANQEDDITDTVLQDILMDKLKSALLSLPAEERKLIKEIFFDEQSERALAEKYGVSQVAIHKRKERILSKLKKQINV